MAEANSDIALLTEHFGYPPVSLLDDIINSINILAERALNSVEQGLLNQPPQALGFKPSPPQQPASKPTRTSRSANAVDPDPDPATAAVSPEAAARHEIENGTHQLETLLCASIDRNFDKFELYVMQNILCVRPSEPRDWIRLGHYDGLDLDADADGAGGGKSQAAAAGEEEPDPRAGRPTVDSVRALRRRLQASQQLNAMLHAERARNAALLDALRAAVGVGGGGGGTGKISGGEKEDKKAAAGPGDLKMEEAENNGRVDGPDNASPPPSAFGFLRRGAGDLAAAAPDDAPLETTAAFALSQLPALRALSTSLRTLMPDLVAAAAGREEEDGGGGGGEDGGRRGERKGWRAERLEYVESAARKHLERVRGLELGPDGEVRDGEWQGEGRNLARDEVEALERVVAVLGGGGGAGPAAGSEEKGDEMDES